jgi:sporulation protein YlmC with PRC-barrel domain
MNKTLTLLSFLVLVAFLGGVGYGYADQSISQSVATTKVFDRPREFSEVTRAMVKDSQGQFVGRITDVVLNPDGRISFAVLSQFAINGKLVALPFNALSFNGKDFVLDTTSEKLANAPLFSRSYLTARSWAEDANRYFGAQPSWGEGAPCEKPADAGRQISMTKGWSRPYGVTEIVGTQVRNPEGEELGKIDDLVFDTEGRISFAIVGYGGFLGMRQNLVAVPVNSLSYVEGQPSHFVLNATREKIESAPLFSRKTLDDPKWAMDVYRYFGQQPAWTKEK